MQLTIQEKYEQVKAKGCSLRSDGLAWNVELPNTVSIGCGFTQGAAVEKAWQYLFGAKEE